MRVIRTAIDVFGRRGYQRASTREIATEAGVNPPALQYYFDSKPGLYHACIDLLTRAVVRRLGPALARAAEALTDDGPDDTLIEQVCCLQDQLIDSVFAVDEGPAIWRLLAWDDEIEETSDARRVMRDRVTDPVLHIVTRMIGRLIGRPADDLQTGLHAFAILGQVTAFHLDRGRIFEALGWETAPSEDSIVLLKAILRSQTTIMLTGLAASRERTGAGPSVVPRGGRSRKP